MRRTNTAFYEGFVSSFFLQPLKIRRKTQHTDFDSMNIGSVQQDWLRVGGDFRRASHKVIKELEPNQQKHLYSLYYRHV
jgi:hypothetical protein